MKTRFLLPSRFKIVGWLLFVPALIALIVISLSDYNLDNFVHTKVLAILNSDLFAKSQYMTIIENNISDEILLVMIMLGGIFIGFSRQRNEDELISKIRYESLVWAVYVNFIVMILATMFVYGTFYLDVMMLNMFTLLFFFIIRFQLMLYRLNKSVTDEE